MRFRRLLHVFFCDFPRENDRIVTFYSEVDLFREVMYTKKMESEKNNYVYILSCSDRSLYTGWTNNLEKRLRAHNEGKGAKYTRNRLPVKLVYHETFASRKEAMKREYQIKQLTRKEKLSLIAAYSGKEKL